MRIFLEEGRRRPRALWRLLVQLAVFTVVLALTTSLLASAWFLLGPARTRELGPEQTVTSPDVFLISTFSSVVAIFISLWFAGRFLDRRRIKDYGFRLDRGWWLDLGFAPSFRPGRRSRLCSTPRPETRCEAG